MIAVCAMVTVIVAQGVNEARLVEIGPRMEEYVKQQKVAGTVTLIAHKGKIIHLEAHGYRSYPGTRMQPDDLFAVASMTKPITAAAVMILVEEGRLALKDPVDKYLPEFSALTLNGTKPKSMPTVQQLLSHTGGFSADTSIEDDDRASMILADFVKEIAKQPLKREPGSGYEYSGPGFAVAGRIVEVVSRQKFEEFLTNRMFKPLGMKNTTFFPSKTMLSRLARLYHLENRKLVELPPETDPSTAKFAGPAGGLYSTARDMWAFFQCMANGGQLDGKRILSPASVDLMSRPQTGSYATDSGYPADYGLGFSIMLQPPRSLTLSSIGSYGHAGALGTHGWVDPKRKLVGIYMSQMFGPSDPKDAFMSMASTVVNE